MVFDAKSARRVVHLHPVLDYPVTPIAPQGQYPADVFAERFGSFEFVGNRCRHCGGNEGMRSRCDLLAEKNGLRTPLQLKPVLALRRKNAVSLQFVRDVRHRDRRCPQLRARISGKHAQREHPWEYSRHRRRANCTPSTNRWQQRWLWCHRTTSTGMVECVSTFAVSLPSRMLDRPLRPCEAIMIRSHLAFFACLMIASYGTPLVTDTLSQSTPTALALAVTSARSFFERFPVSSSKRFLTTPAFGMTKPSSMIIWNSGVTLRTVIFAPMDLASRMHCFTAFCESGDPSVGSRMCLYIEPPFVDLDATVAIAVSAICTDGSAESATR